MRIGANPDVPSHCEKQMHFRTILSGTLAILLLSGGAASALDSGSLQPVEKPAAGLSVPLPPLSSLFGLKKAEPAQQQIAQVSDPRVTALEEQIRSLSGTIEELNFQILQMQEQMRKMQEDNEFRFEELEKGKKSDAGTTGDNTVAQAPAVKQPAESAGQAASDDTPALAEDAPAPGDDAVAVQQPGAVASADPSAGAPPTTFGTITFDAKGNVTGGSVGDQITEAPAAPVQGNKPVGSTDNTVVAALPATDDPEELYRNSYEFILSGDYGTAESGFRDHIKRFPADPKTADARFWLGESLLGQKKYRDAAEIFLAANKDYPSAKKAPDMLLKLGVSLVGLDQHDVACATFSEIGKRYPNMSGALKDRIKQEQALASC
jgi:tol-pal system protein YbgF